MTTLQSKIYVGGNLYTIAELLKNMRIAFSKYEALRWAFYIQKAFIELGYNPDIDKTMNELMASMDIPAVVVSVDDDHESDSSMPEVLINYIFKSEFNKDSLKNLWCWIKEYFIDEISYPYQYLALLLFLENHHSLLSQNQHISNIEMQNQMETWFPKATIKCSADALGTYRNGYFNSNKFKYASWLNSTGEPPIGYEYKKDQTLIGFKALHKHCNNLELYLSELKL